ncbi:lymphokine-activated killer T-cell-originated protein kinase [Folsomia candida]|uniref:Lymphokine-activated killer T-cell-originated protein kinase n=1 Tax=Folsomia candida TaxID=158441 RepID=A0A226F6N3_FOLCA|nr:lymphokine-activated killer T-cell-originated protein kinase [Folsomia candida]OXA65114.1 Lymphokine-activated killer T-cell-originated protein kinase [Folsomia candida]
MSQDEKETGSQLSQGSSSGDSQNEFLTPKQFRHKKVNFLRNTDMTKSPSFMVPASPTMKRLGYGTGVGVYLMERSPRASGEVRSPWAIKKISKLRKDTKLFERRLEFEAEILRNLTHPNIIGYRAFGNPTTDVTFLAMEKASKSLFDLIEDRVEELTPDGVSPFPALKIFRVAVDVAQALHYLHEEKKLIHGDLKSGNVLVFGDFDAVKLCDFGVARKIKDDGLVDGLYVGTEIWNPMEVVLANRGQKKYPVTAKVDIYPYALTLHEMISLKIPHFNTAEEDYGESMGDNDNSQSESSYDEHAFDEALGRQLGKRPTLPDFAFDESYNTILGVFYVCSNENPQDRPTAEEILSMLSENETNIGKD